VLTLRTTKTTGVQAEFVKGVDGFVAEFFYRALDGRGGKANGLISVQVN
jgi:hypothetical protein